MDPALHRIKSQEENTVLRYDGYIRKGDEKMNWINDLQKAINYLEDNLTEDISLSLIHI